MDIAGLGDVARAGCQRARLLDRDRAVDRHAPQHDSVVGANLGEPGEVNNTVWAANKSP